MILEEEGCRHLPQFLRITASRWSALPYYKGKEMDRVRGDGSFDAAIRVIKILNGLGYGKEEGLVLNMVYNPAGAFFPPEQAAMEREYKTRLMADYGIVFNQLFTITNNPTGRFYGFLERSGNLNGYMQKLSGAFNGGTLSRAHVPVPAFRGL